MQSRGNVPAVSEIKRPGRNEEEFRDECASFRFRFAPMNGDSDGKKVLGKQKEAHFELEVGSNEETRSSISVSRRLLNWPLNTFFSHFRENSLAACAVLY